MTCFLSGCFLRGRRFFLKALNGGDPSNSGAEVGGEPGSAAEKPLPDGPSPTELAEVEVFWVLVDSGLIGLAAAFGPLALADAGTFRISWFNAGSFKNVSGCHKVTTWNLPRTERACPAVYTRSPRHAFPVKIPEPSLSICC